MEFPDKIIRGDGVTQVEYVRVEKVSSELLSAVQKHISSLKGDHERIEFISSCMKNYCKLCGCRVNKKKCYCASDYDI